MLALASNYQRLEKGLDVMSKYYWATPEEIERTRKRNKTLLMIAVPVVTVILSAVVTLLLH
ncbi:hypothetical protein [Metabacillus rhizolycopersici]|uniref:Uncharacterized protein n=1 Tax=Metabacillus rhizolycopersici TaxID=2875709 RepID=A0ABS7ULN2_9BACI|nr:hypothetical protein [Metabacillus rhizolycopersici]MBZ5749066.1 hypothetical protein [Metabacillus rhizolycopersici]